MYNLADLVFVSWKKRWKYVVNHNFKDSEFKTYFKFIKNTTVKVSKNVCCSWLWFNWWFQIVSCGFTYCICRRDLSAQQLAPAAAVTHPLIPFLFSLLQVRPWCSLSLPWFSSRPLEFCPLLNQSLLLLGQPRSYLIMWWMWYRPLWQTAQQMGNFLWPNLSYKVRWKMWVPM